MQFSYLIKSVFCFLCFTSLCFATEAAHDPTRPATYADSQQPSLMNTSDANQQVTLNGILISPLQRIALVNGIAFQVGETEAGIKMLSIGEDVVRISKDQQEVQLAFPSFDQKAIVINESKSSHEAR